MNTKSVIVSCLVAPIIVAFGASDSNGGQQPSQRPNIVVIVSDDQGWGDVGYHNDEIRSPNLDRLASEGTKLECHYVQPQCTPTRVALLTGRYPSRFGRHCTSASNEKALPDGTLTMASMLKSVGYDTGLFGKWHLGSKQEWGPNHFGFNYSYGSLAGAVGMYDHRYRLKTPFSQTWHRNHEFVEEVGHATDLVTAEAIKFLKTKRDGPYFLYVPFQSVHTPLVEDVRWHEKNEHIVNPSRRLFAAAVTHLDHCVGQIIKAIDDSGDRGNTLIIFTSDNGGLLNYPGGNYPPPDPALKEFSSNLPLRGQKTDVYEGGYRVPAIVNWPSRLKPRSVTAPMHVVDWMPTIANLIGFEIEEDPAWDGVDVWPKLAGTETKSEPRQFYITWGGDSKLALRDGDWKILRNGKKKEWELYNLKNDPVEQTNLATSKPELVKIMLDQIEQQKKKDAR